MNKEEKYKGCFRVTTFANRFGTKITHHIPHKKQVELDLSSTLSEIEAIRLERFINGER